MKILYLSQLNIDLSVHGIYSDLINTLSTRGHAVTLVCTNSGIKKSYLKKINDIDVVYAKLQNQFGVNFIKKGLVLLSLERNLKRAVKKFLGNTEYDLILYATPPVTMAKVVRYCKKRYQAKSYLMLKDIFPQNAVDMGLLTKRGWKKLAYEFFKKKELDLYRGSDKIGCMSNANRVYLLKHNPYLKEEQVEVFPNAISITEGREKNREILLKYGIDTQKIVFILGGNLGIPLGLDFYLRAIQSCSDLNAHFVIVGKGSEKDRIFQAAKEVKNLSVLDYIPHEEYQDFAAGCDVGVVLLDHRFTIPNYPSRVIPYMQNALPVFACTDDVTDIGKTIEEDAKCGKWCHSGDIKSFYETVMWFTENVSQFSELGENGNRYLRQHFDVQITVKQLEIFVDGR